MWDPFWTFGPTIADFGASRQASEASSRASAAEMRVRELEHRVERLALACNAMWGLLRDQTGLTDQQLQEKIQHIDSADGVTDGARGPEYDSLHQMWPACFAAMWQMHVLRSGLRECVGV